MVTLHLLVAGVTFEGRQQYLYRLYLRGILPEIKLEGEPDNPMDRFAVKVVAGERHVGYVPQKVSKEISELLRRRAIRRVFVVGIGLANDVYYMRIGLKVVEEENGVEKGDSV